MTTSDLIKIKRLEYGLTQKQVAENLGISAPSYAQYEQGKRSPKFDTLERIAAAIGCDTFDLIDFGKDLSPEEEAAIESETGDTELDQLLLEWKDVDNNLSDALSSASLQGIIKWTIDLLERRKNLDRLPPHYYPLPHDPDSIAISKIYRIMEKLNLNGKEKVLSYASDLADMEKYQSPEKPSSST